MILPRHFKELAEEIAELFNAISPELTFDEKIKFIKLVLETEKQLRG